MRCPCARCRILIGRRQRHAAHARIELDRRQEFVHVFIRLVNFAPFRRMRDRARAARRIPSALTRTLRIGDDGVVLSIHHCVDIPPRQLRASSRSRNAHAERRSSLLASTTTRIHSAAAPAPSPRSTAERDIGDAPARNATRYRRSPSEGMSCRRSKKNAIPRGARLSSLPSFPSTRNRPETEPRAAARSPDTGTSARRPS